MSMILRCEMAHALADEGNDGWTVHWGTASAVADLLPPGKHEFGESWFLNVAPGERGIDLSLLLAIVAAASAAIAVDGRILDESSLVGGGNIGGGELLVRASGGPERSATDALIALGSPAWGE